MNNSAKASTFWNLINIHRIEIPIIQRDYAQGRPDSKATQIRQGFVRALVTNLEKSAPLHLDFVYGKIGGKADVVKIENNKKAIANLLKSVQSYSDTLDISFEYKIDDRLETINSGVHTFFIPLDGQQRLTTLFLLHWYVAAQLSLDVSQILSRFSYETRRSSRKFCLALVNRPFKVPKDKQLSEVLKDLPWFFQNWLKDPTVRSMLAMLDEIQNHLNEKTADELLAMWHNLTGNAVTFEFLDLDKFELTDELYIKMNARGKHLTDFENFKAWLQEYTAFKKTQVKIDNWHKRLDVEWMDLFWSYKKTDTYEIDDEYLSFFDLLSLYFIAENAVVENNRVEESTRSMIDLLRKSEFITDELYEQEKCFTAGKLNRILSVLAALEGDGASALEKKLSHIFPETDKGLPQILFGSENSSLGWWDTTYLYALVCFLNFKDINVAAYNADDDRQLQNWMRIMRNLVYNVYIFTPETFVNAIKSIKRLSVHCENIYEYLTGPKADIAFFTMVQKDEELLKAKLIIENSDWEAAFIHFEKHNYFNGQLGFLLEISKGDNYDLERFQINAAKAAAIFEPDILDDPEFIFQRAFLSLKNYFLQDGRNRSFCSNNTAFREKEENWRKVFREKERLEAFKSLLNAVTLGKERAGLQHMIKAYVGDSWKHYFVKSSDPFDCCDRKLIRFEDNGDKIFLLKTSRIYGSHAELRTYVFYCKYIYDRVADYVPFKKEWYYYNPGNDGNPCIVLEGYKFKSKSYKLEIFYIHVTKRFQIVLVPTTGNISTELTSSLTACGMKEEDEEGFCCYANSQSGLKNKLLQICEILR